MGTTSTFFGTAFNVAGAWYARHEGGRGVLLPLSASQETQSMLQDGQAYELEGVIELDHRGCAVAARVSGAKAIGTEPNGRV